MSEEQTVVTETPSSAEAPATVDQVYEQFNVEAEAQQFQRQPVQTQQYQQPQATPQASPMAQAIPDPVLDANGFKSWLATQNQSIQQALSGVQQFQQQLMVAEMQRREVAEVQATVDEVNKAVGLPDEQKDLIEFALAKRVREDAKFRTLYANRNQNPRAWKAALNAVTPELKDKFALRADPQLAENQRAVKTAQSALSTTKPQASPDEDRFAGKTGADFDREWSRYVSGSVL